MSLSKLSPGSISRLPNGLRPFDDESLAGFVMRLAGNHGYDRPLSLLEPLRIRTKSLRIIAEQHAEDPVLANFLALKPDELARLSGGLGGGRRVLGHKLPIELINQSTRRVCPRCLDERPYHRAVWDVSVLTVCPTHGGRLLKNCHVCKKLLTWEVGPLTHCSSPKCAADLRMARCEAVREEEMFGVRAIELMFRDGFCEDHVPQIRALPVADQLMLMLHLGNQDSGARSVPRPTRLLSTSGDKLHKILSRGDMMCSRWPENYHQILEGWHRASESRSGRYGVRKSFGNLRIPTIAAIDSDRNQPPVPIEASRAFR